MTPEVKSDLSGTILYALKSQDLVEVNPSSLKPIIVGRFTSLFTIDTNRGLANIQVRSHQTAYQISFNTSDIHLALTIG